MTDPASIEPVIALAGVGKSFRAVRALAGVDLRVRPGRIVALMGHNGAGKSTLMHVLAGTLERDEGVLSVAGQPIVGNYDVRRAHRLGIRCVFQELSLCTNLTVGENTRVYHRSLSGWRWRARASQLIVAKLDEIFPGHGIAADQIVSELSIGWRQMVEVARGFTVTDEPVRLVILDEPTSALDSHAAEQLMQFARRFCAAGGAVIFISHRMVEVMTHTDDVVVMRDGRVVGGGPTRDFAEARIIEMMGMIEAPAGKPVETRGRSTTVRVEEGTFRAHAGEVVGLAGLAGHGQREILQRTFAAASRRTPGGRRDTIGVHGSVAYVAGDRQTEGVFPLWSVARNISVGLKGRIARAGIIDLAAESSFAEVWRKRFGIRVPDVATRITALSGGNQQKVLVARAFAREADIVLLDDPLRGVDVGTKTELYAQVREAADAGRCFIWYMTETAELQNCDVVYTFYEGRITDIIPRSELTERRVLESSFGEAAGHVS